LALVLVDHCESYLGFPGLQDDVATTADDHGAAVFFAHGDQGHVIDEVDLREERDFLLGKVTSYTEEATIERLGAAAADGRNELGPVVRSKRTGFDPASIAQQINRGVIWLRG